MLLRPTALGSTLLLCLTLGVLPATATPGAPQQRPVPNDDRYAVLSSGSYLLPVLENDEVSFLGDGELTLCGVTVDDASTDVLYAEIDRDDPRQVYVETDRAANRVATFRYDACQGDERATSTVTVDITRLLEPTVTKKHNRRARIVVRNPNSEARLRFLWGNPRTSRADGEKVVGPGRRTTIKVSRTRIFWVSYVRDQGSVVVAGGGTVARIRKK